MAVRIRTGASVAYALIAALGVSAVLALLPVSAARAAIMRIGRLPAMPVGADVVGSVRPDELLRVSVALRPRDPAGLASYARAVSTAGSASFHAYLTPSQFARRFGASPAEVRGVRNALLARGLRPGMVSAGALSIPIFATAASLERGFSVSLQRVALTGRRTAITASAAPALEAPAAGDVQAVIGLDTVASPQPLLVRPPAGSRSRAGISLPLAVGHVATGGPQPCNSAGSVASTQGGYTADQIASAYGYSGLYGAGDLGAGTTVAIYELEPVDPSDLAAYQSCYGTHTSITYVPVDGGPGPGPGSGEAALDIENLLGLAPDAKLLVYQGQNSNSGNPGSGPYDTFNAIISQDRAKVVSVSWGECESQLGAADASAENSLFEEAAVQGQTIVTAAGDNGSEDCDGESVFPQTQLAVDDPASQPFVIGVGGTTLSAIGPRPTESVWNTGGALGNSSLQAGAGGGGISTLWPLPAGQRAAAPGLNVLGAGVTGSQCGQAGGYCREVPDVVADADPATGYVVYWNGSDQAFGQPQGWQVIGGTSAAAPVWAALMALTDSSQACGEGGSIGYGLPALYRAAGASYAADFNDVQTGNNDFTQTHGGRYAAGPGYDEASGLGSPNGAALASALCPATLRITTPKAQQSAARATVSLPMRAQDVSGVTVQFRATGLPAGLSIDHTTGRITGRARRTGTYHVVVVAMDSQGSVVGARFEWVVGGAARILDPTLTGLASGQPTLSFTVAAGHHSPAVDAFMLSVSRLLRFTSAGGVQVNASGSDRARFAAHTTDGTLVIDLKHALVRARVTVAYPALRLAGGRHPNSSQARGLQLELQVTDAARGSSGLHASL